MLYLEDAPLGPSVAATGLSKAFNATFSALVSYATGVCIVQTHQHLDSSHFVEEWRCQPAWAASRLSWMLARLYARLPWHLARLAASFHGRYIAWRLRLAFKVALPPGTRILAPIGVDPLTLVRADSLARCLFANLEPYLVDDIQNHPSNHLWQADLGDALSCLLQRAARVYTITDGLGDLMQARHAVRPITLHLVAASTGEQASCSRENSGRTFAFFLGSVNHLYAEGLRRLIEQVAEMRLATGQDLTIRMSSSPEQVMKELGEVPPWVIVGPIADQAQLHQEIVEATFCYLPYSFSEDARSMVESSFPSKMIDYLAHANAILVLAPISAVPFRLLSEHRMPYTCSNPDMLSEQLYTLLEERPMLSAKYRDLLVHLFSVTAMRRTLGFPDTAK